MSEKVKELAEKIAALPDALQEKYLNRAEGAIEVMDLMAEDAEKKNAADSGK